MKILVTPTSFLKPQNAEAQRMVEEFADEVIYNDLGVPLAGDQIIDRLDGVDGYIAGVDYITADVIERMPDTVKVISRYGAGVDRVDIDACTKKGIIVTNTPGANSVAVCELAFGLMLAVSRNIPKLHKAVDAGEWPRNEGVELCGKRLGIVGMGAIGKNLAVRAKAFGMDVCECEPDKQGRILLPLRLRNHIKAEKELVIIGVGRRAELWSEEGWNRYNEVTYADYEETLAKLAELGI